MIREKNQKNNYFVNINNKINLIINKSLSKSLHNTYNIMIKTNIKKLFIFQLICSNLQLTFFFAIKFVIKLLSLYYYYY